MSKKITLENVDSSELPEVPVIGEVKQIRFTQDMELVSTLADSDLFMIQAGADLEARPNTITFDLIIKNLSGPIEEGSEKFVTGDMMFKVIGDMNLLDTWDNTNLVSSLNATFVNVRRIEEELRREINRSTGKDDLHDTQIANLRQDLTSTNEMLNQEINRSVAKDKEHDELLEGLRDDVDSTSSKLDAEINRSTTKDAEHDTLLKGLRVDVNANKSAIDSEVARSTARDEAHDAAISKNASDIATESSRAKAEEAKIRQEMQSADTNLQNAITAETERATGVEEDLQRQITDLSGSTDDRLEALEALSHEQNTDTGTTSKTFVIDSGNTGAMLKAEGGGLSTRTKGDAGYANFTVQNLVIKGDVTQEGDTFITQAERVEVRDNMILINEGETGAGVTAGFAGIEVDRGTEQNFMFGFNESDGMFKIGKEGNMFDVALRQPVGDMIDGMFASWDAATKTFKTTNLIPYNKSLDFKFDPEIADATLKMKFMEAGLALSMSGDDSILALLPGIPQDEVKYSLISTNTNGIILGDSSGSNDKFILDIKKPSFISPVLDKNVIIGGKNAYFSYYSHLAGSPNTIIASCGVEAPSFYRASDNAEVLYSLDQARLTDGMFLSWDAANKMVVTTNVIPPTLQLYFKDNNTSIKYSTANNGSLAFMTMGKGWRVFTNDTFTQFSSDANKFYFIGDINVSTGNIYTNLTGLRLSAKTASVMIRDGGSVLNTPLTSTTYYRSSDDSEVLYQADLKSVLTGKETNYAPTVKAVSDAIDSVNTGTTESLKGYLKLSGGTMTGSIRIVDSGNSDVLQGIYNNDGTKALLFTYLKGSESRWGVGSKDLVGIIRSNVSDLIHLVNNNNTLTEYPIYDKRNLPDPATKSGNNAFTGTNSFVANKFSVGNFRVDSDSNLGVNTPYREGLERLSRSLYFKYNDLEDTKVSFGSVSSSTVANYAYIGIGSVRLDNAQYKFRTESLDLNTIFRIDFGDASAISAGESTIVFGSDRRSCYVRSNDTDLVHIKNSNSYKIWDASNLPTPATKSGNNAFTGTNSFVANKFSVGNFRVDSDSNLGVNTPYREGLERLSRSLYFKYNDLEDTKVSFGSVSSSTVANYAYIGIGSVRLDNAQYKFRTESLDLNTIFRIDFGDASAISAGESTIVFGSDRRSCYVRSNDTDLVHIKNSNSYKIWDASNLPTPASTSDIPDVSDMAKKSEANTFTAQNTFTAGQFNVGPFEVSSTGQLLVNITTSGGWERSITFKANSDNATSIRIGGHGIGSTSNFAWIGVGDVEYDTAQYRFYGTSMKVPSVWSLDDADGNSLIWTQSTQLAHIGRATGTTKIRSGAVDLIHTKGATDYKILDESNYSQYLPTNNKWTYGFVNTYIEGSNADFNTLFAGPDSPKILFNYYRPIGNNTNAPTGMSYGAVLQIDGNYNSAYNNVVLRPQLAFDINHNVENGTRYMWFRTANNLGYGDSSNWKRVVTADENVAVLVMDANTYPSIARIDGTTYNWLRTPAQGLLPNTQATLDSGGTSYLGTNDWSFGYASIHTIYSKRYMFGNTGVDFRLDTNNKIAATISGSARGIEIGDLLVSSNYGEDAAKVPTNGIFASGIIKSYSGFSSSSRINNLNISKASNDALLISSFAGENVINKPGVDPVSGQSVGDGVALTYFWDGDYAFQLVGDIDGTGMAYRKYTPSTGNSTDWKFLADTKWVNTKLGGYLPLTGGILSGQLIINSISNSLILNNTNSSETESFIKVQLNGTSKAAIGFLSSIGSYIYNYESNKYLFVGTDGAYLGNTISKAKLLTSADLSGYATQTWANSKFAPLSTFKILSGYPAIVNVGNEFILTSNQSSMYVNYRTPSNTIIPTTWYWKNGTSTGYANGYWGDLYMVEKLVATQEWVSGRGYLTSITKSMVTSALGYTPPTTNTTYSQATSSTLGLVKIGATGLAAKNYAVQLNSSGQMYVAVPWTDTSSTYSAATSSTYGLVKIGATGLAAKNYAVQLNSSGQMYVSVPWTDTDTNTHYTTRLYAGASGTAANAAASNPYLKVTDDNTYRNQVRFIGAGATSISSDASGNITITSTNTTYDLSGYATQTWANSKFAPLSTFKILSGYPAIVNVGNEFILTSNQSSMYVNYRTPSNTIIPTTWYWKNGTSTGYANGYWGDLYMVEKLVATQEWVSGRGYLTSITKSMVTSALGYTPPTTNTTYSQATSSTLGLVKIGATGLAAKNYAVQLNSSGQMYVAVPWTDTSSTYSAATSSTYGLVKIGATGLAAKNYAVQLNSSGQMYVSVPWTDTDTNTHYTTRLYAGASGTAANAAASNPYLKVTDDNTYRNQVRFIGAGATSISSDASGNITITSTNTTYDLASSSSNGLMSSSQYAKLSNCIETVSAANMVTSVQVVDTIPGESSQVTGRLYLKFA